MIPMGTVVTVCMLVGLIYALVQLSVPGVRRLSSKVHAVPAVILGLAGAWNTFWHGTRNLTDFWGLAALASGIVMMLGAYLIYRQGAAQVHLFNLRPLVLIALAGFFLLYAIAIYRL